MAPPSRERSALCISEALCPNALPKNTVPGAASCGNVGKKKILLICKLTSCSNAFPGNKSESPHTLCRSAYTAASQGKRLEEFCSWIGPNKKEVIRGLRKQAFVLGYFSIYHQTPFNTFPAKPGKAVPHQGRSNNSVLSLPSIPGLRNRSPTD